MLIPRRVSFKQACLSFSQAFSRKPRRTPKTQKVFKGAPPAKATHILHTDAAWGDSNAELVFLSLFVQDLQRRVGLGTGAVTGETFPGRCTAGDALSGNIIHARGLHKDSATIITAGRH